MKDIHNHIIYGVDDGSKDIEESLEMLRKAYNNGYTDIIVTPHFYKGKNYCSLKDVNIRILDNLKKCISDNNIKLNLYLGNELFIDENIFFYLENNYILTLNNSRYLLVEFPLNSKINNIHDIIFRLVSMGITPIIAHPERYSYYINLNEFEQMINEGALFQGNIGSLYKKYGSFAKERLELMLKKHMIHFIGSDVHDEKSNSYKRVKDLKKRLKKLTKNKKMVEELTNTNISKVINNEEINSYKIKKHFIF